MSVWEGLWVVFGFFLAGIFFFNSIFSTRAIVTVFFYFPKFKNGISSHTRRCSDHVFPSLVLWPKIILASPKYTKQIHSFLSKCNFLKS